MPSHIHYFAGRYIAHIEGAGTVLLTADFCEAYGIDSIEKAKQHIEKDQRERFGVNVEWEVVSAGS